MSTAISASMPRRRRAPATCRPASWPCRWRTTTGPIGVLEVLDRTSETHDLDVAGDAARQIGLVVELTRNGAEVDAVLADPALRDLIALVRRLGAARRARPGAGRGAAQRGGRARAARLDDPVAAGLVGGLHPRPAADDPGDALVRADQPPLGLGRRLGCRRPGGGDRQRDRRRAPRGRRGGGRGRDRAGRDPGLRRTGHRGPPRRPLRPRHGVRGDHPRPGSGVRAVQRAGPRRLTVGAGDRLRRRSALGHRGRDECRQPESQYAERGADHRVLRPRRPGGLRQRDAGQRGEQPSGAELSLAVRRRVLGRGVRGARPRAFRGQSGPPGGVRRAGHRPRGGLDRRRDASPAPGTASPRRTSPA